MWQNSPWLGVAVDHDIMRHPLYRVRRPCRLNGGFYNLCMTKRTSPSDAEKISVAADLEELVQDKREGWRASGAKARRRQRRYKALLTQQLLKLGPTPAGEPALDDDAQV